MNCDDLTKELCALYTGLKNGKIKPVTALEMTRAATAIQAGVRLQLLNARMRNETPDLAFFKKPPAKRTKSKEAANG